MRTPCLVCRAPVQALGRNRCPRHRVPARRIRSSYAWTKLSAQVRSRGLCSSCGRPTRPAELEADHVIPASLRPDLALSPANVVALCRPCHLRKTHGPA
jgi:5-methylcytosine-specific restriction endonuclease McrA